MISPQISDNIPVPLDEFTVVHDTDMIRLESLLFDEHIQQRSNHAMRYRFESNFIKNLYKFGFVVMSTHGTPTIVRVPCAYTLTMKNVPTWEGPRTESIFVQTNRTLGGVDVTRREGTYAGETTSTGRMSSIGTRTNVGGTPVAHYTKGSPSL